MFVIHFNTEKKNACTEYASPVGTLYLTASEEYLNGLFFDEGAAEYADSIRDPSHPILQRAIRELDEYFHGSRARFDVPIEFSGTTFRSKVWRALLQIHYAETISYGELARRIGRPKASRAVGLANGANPISIIVPCHRVIGANGSLTGYGGGLDRKKWLLEHEQRHPRSPHKKSDAVASRQKS